MAAVAGAARLLPKHLVFEKEWVGGRSSIVKHHATPGRRRVSCRIRAETAETAEGPSEEERAARVQMYHMKPLRYAPDALEPYISRKAVEAHRNSHHQSAVDSLYEQTKFEETLTYPLDHLVSEAYVNGAPKHFFNSAAEVYNHELYFDNMKPDGGGDPPEELLPFIEREFGSFDAFKEEFRLAAKNTFGSGYVWLVVKPERYSYFNMRLRKFRLPYQRGVLEVENTLNAINPAVWNHVPLIVLDVWEHAYYLDYQGDVGRYVDDFFNHLVNWDEVMLRFQNAQARFNLYTFEVPADGRLFEDPLLDNEETVGAVKRLR